MMTIPRFIWWLPRPKKDKYPGGVPLHFEKKLYEMLNIDEEAKILQPFGGAGERGTIMDIKDTGRQDIIGDAHDMPFPDNTFDLTLCDPPYSTEEGKKLYGTPPLKRNTWIKEAVRVTKKGGFIVLYHRLLLPRPEGCKYHSIGTVITRINHAARIVSIYTKE